MPFRYLVTIVVIVFITLLLHAALNNATLPGTHVAAQIMPFQPPIFSPEL